MTKHEAKVSKAINERLRDMWIGQYGSNYKIREYLSCSSTSYTHLELKRIIANDISIFLTKNGIEPSAANIDAFIELMEPVIDTRDYIAELGSEEVDIEDYPGC